MELRLDEDCLHADLGRPHHALSWGVVNGGLVQTRHVAWHQVRNSELSADVDAVQLLRERMAHHGHIDAVGLLTSSAIADYTARESGGVTCVCTLGLGNRLRVGDPPGAGSIGTINLLVVCPRPLACATLAEVMSIATEARTAAVMSLGIESVRSGEAATGTGTDCIVVCAPLGTAEPLYAGKHTELGSAVGQAVLNAVGASGRTWLEAR